MILSLSAAQIRSPKRF